MTTTDDALPPFKDAWAVYVAKGYQYGRDALEGVEFGYRIAREALSAKANTAEDAGLRRWSKASLEVWAQCWTRTPATVLQAFIDAGLCSDQSPARAETALTPDRANITIAVRLLLDSLSISKGKEVTALFSDSGQAFAFLEELKRRSGIAEPDALLGEGDQ